MKKTFVVYKDREAFTKMMNIEEKAEFLDAMFYYQNDQNTTDFVFTQSSVRVVFGKILDVFRDDKSKREKTRELRSELGKKGGLAKASKSYQKLAKARKVKLPSNSYSYIYYTNIDNIKDIFIKLLWKEYCSSMKDYLYVLIDMVELWYSLPEDKNEIEKEIDWIKETGIRYNLQISDIQQKVMKWKTWWKNKWDKPKNYKNSIYTFLK